MIALHARVVGEGLAPGIVDAFLNADFDAGCHIAWVAMIKALED